MIAPNNRYRRLPIRLAAAIVWIAAAAPLARAAVAPLEETAVPAVVVRPERTVDLAPPEMPAPDLSVVAPIVPEKQAPKSVRVAKPRGYDLLILEYARRYAVDAALVKAVIHAESRFDPQARSHKGAVGLMQLMPRTAKAYGVRNLTNPRDNIRAGVQHLKRLLSRHRNVKNAIAAYNAGSHTVRRHGGVPPYPETRHYVTKVMRYHGKYQRDPLFSVSKTPRPVDRPFVERIHHEDMGTRG